MSAIKVSYKNKDYILEFTRNTAKMMERNGFELENITSKPNTMIPMLFQGAFIKNHSNIKTKIVDEIYDEIPNKGEFLNKLIELFLETMTSLTEDSEEGNAQWETV